VTSCLLRQNLMRVLCLMYRICWITSTSSFFDHKVAYFAVARFAVVLGCSSLGCSSVVSVVCGDQWVLCVEISESCVWRSLNNVCGDQWVLCGHQWLLCVEISECCVWRSLTGESCKWRLVTVVVGDWCLFEWASATAVCGDQRAPQQISDVCERRLVIFVIGD
jgi:hypothetical protein